MSYRTPAQPLEFELDDLYRDLILDHYRAPRNHAVLPHPSCTREGENPLCGDQVTLQVELADGRLRDIAFQGLGCSISQASTSMMTECIKGKALADVRDVMQQFKTMMLEGAEPTPALGDLEALQGVRKFPVRVKCATLGWNVLEQLLEDNSRQEAEGRRQKHGQ